MNNPKYKQLLEKVRSLAEKSENVRAVFIIGSCVRKIEKADAYSDIDFIVIANEMDEFIHQRNWVETLGKPLFLWTDHEAGWASWDRRVLFDDFLEADFVLFQKSQLEQQWLASFVGSMLTSDYEMLIDKDDISSLVRPFLYSEEAPQSDEEILNEIHDFFFHCNWIKKKIDRGALFIAHNCLNEHMKKKLLFMMEASAKIKHGETCNTWFEGRFIEKWADRDSLAKLEKCFATYHKEEILNALRNQIILYTSLSEKLCQSRGISFPEAAVDTILDHTGLLTWGINP